MVGDLLRPSERQKEMTSLYETDDVCLVPPPHEGSWEVLGTPYECWHWPESACKPQLFDFQEACKPVVKQSHYSKLDYIHVIESYWKQRSKDPKCLPPEYFASFRCCLRPQGCLSPYGRNDRHGTLEPCFLILCSEISQWRLEWAMVEVLYHRHWQLLQVKTWLTALLMSRIRRGRENVISVTS